MPTILITGSNSDIGIAVTKAVAQSDSRMLLQYFSNSEKTRQLGSWLTENSIDHCIYQADLTQPEEARAMVEHAIYQYGQLDVLINIVGPFVYKSILEVSPDEWLADFDLNLHSCFYVCHYALKELIKTQGHVINFAYSGVENPKARPMSTGYCAAKSGVMLLTKSLAVALADHKVRVNGVCPGLVEEDQISAAERLEMASQIPFGRPVVPEEIGKAVKWLIYDSPEIMTGSLLTVAGGWEY